MELLFELLESNYKEDERMEAKVLFLIWVSKKSC